MLHAVAGAVVRLGGAAAGLAAGRILGRRLGDSRRWAAAAALIAGIAALAVWWIFGLGPLTEGAALAFLFLFGNLCACAEEPRGWGRRILETLLWGVLSAWLTLETAGPLGAVWVLERSSPKIRDGVVMQTAGFSCLPACAATCLSHLGVPGTEARLAEESETSFNGTLLPKMARVLDRKLVGRGFRARVSDRSWDTLPRDGIPAILDVRCLDYSHAFAFLGFEEDRAVVGDPLIGRKQMARWQLEQIWAGKCIVFSREGQ